jgi:ketose-bisphosphate aldolase
LAPEVIRRDPAKAAAAGIDERIGDKSMHTVRSCEALQEAHREGWALGAFNATGFEVVLAAGRAAAACSTPVIVQFSDAVVRGYGIQLIKGWFDLVGSLTAAEMFLNLDHCSDEGLILQCLDAGWDMVTFDGSHHALETNIRLTHRVVGYAHRAGVGTEAVLGRIGGHEEGASASPHAAVPSAVDVQRFVTETGVDCLAVGFGTQHGHYGSDKRLRWDALESAAAATEIPLVLHGGTGLADAEFRRAIQCGCAKINISTALKDQYRAALTTPSLAEEAGSRPIVFHLSLLDKCQLICEQYITRFRGTGAE